MRLGSGFIIGAIVGGVLGGFSGVGAALLLAVVGGGIGMKFAARRHRNTDTADPDYGWDTENGSGSGASGRWDDGGDAGADDGGDDGGGDD